VQPEVSLLDGVLKDHLGMQEGTKEKLFRGTPQEQTVERLIVEGARSEDDPFTRVFNHFHNPLASQWQEAGLRAFLGAVRGQSSVLWQQNTNQNLSLVFMPAPFPSLGGNWSWQDTRKRYLDALTGETKEQRDQAFADTFLGLGHLIHLVQDASVPAHVRNDPHPSATVPGFGSKIGNPDWYEDWVEQMRAEHPPLFQSLLGGTPLRPSLSIFAATTDAQAPVPVARLIDTDKFLGLNFSVLIDPELGISEYTNGNFLSRDTIFTDFDLPRQTSLDPTFIVEPVGAKFRRYLQKVSEGETVRHFVTEGLLYTTLKQAVGAGPVPAGGWTLDDEHVHVDYAAKLLPRAVGYSAALLDYFFRGSLAVRAYWDNGKVVLDLSNEGDEIMEGVFEVYAIYDKDSVGERRVKLASLEGGAVTTLQAGSSQTFQVDVPSGQGLTHHYILVFRGRLGEEADAVVGHLFLLTPRVLFVQQDSLTDIKLERCDRYVWPDPGIPSSDGTLAEESLSCWWWTPANRQFSGRLVKNVVDPIIQRIVVRTGLSDTGTRSATIWERQGAEPDPVAIAFAAADSPFFWEQGVLFLDIQLTDGPAISTRLATFGFGLSSHTKEIIYEDAGRNKTYAVISKRSAYLAISSDRDRDKTISISGYTNPTNTLTEQRYGSLTASEGVVVGSNVYQEYVITTFEIYQGGWIEPPKFDPGYAAPQAAFDAIQIQEGLPIKWEAVIERVYYRGEAEFLRAFMPDVPPQFTIQLSGPQQ
jgi:hypothetical protein